MNDPGDKKDDISMLAKKMAWVEDPAKVRLAIKCLAILCVILFVLDLVIHRHSYFSIEGWVGFYAVAGFAAFTVIVIGAKNLRRLILRDENYYGSQAVDSEDYPEADTDQSDSEGTQS